ncbi:hypothetical protein FA15DRAFT_753523 [Coprinopsis marcescibilis]|uniref:Nudix hydrolase domain-containing protein n=1 Tax=Coprinopsis marcescibilis TaxID=230819 RepID=A0A5C3L784_COPMA|nr:hypothetical protein FA15DRAFT_753523 [Coprinopsis marcescibilis]
MTVETLRLVDHDDAELGSGLSRLLMALQTEGLRQEKEVPNEFIEAYPKNKQAAVLVLLVNLTSGKSEHAIDCLREPADSSQLFVVLTTRGKGLRTHGGETSLPGGKRDEEDVEILHTAYREAHEEIGLPLPEFLTHICTTCDRCAQVHPTDSTTTTATSPSKNADLARHIHTLGMLPPLPFHTLLVRPVIAFISRPDLIFPHLAPNPGEVDRIFLHPLKSIISPGFDHHSGENTLPVSYGEVMPPSALVAQGSEFWPYDEPFHNHLDYTNPNSGAKYRLHRFQTCASPITGLTADILIHIARVTYGKEPDFGRYMEGQTEDWVEMTIQFLKDRKDIWRKS